MKNMIIKMLSLWLVMIFVCPLISSTVAATITPSDNCPRKCGNIDVPYPFGINHTTSSNIINPKYCSFNKSFVLQCNSSYDPPRLYFGNMPVHRILLEEGTISVGIPKTYDCYDENGRRTNSTRWSSIKLGGGPFRFSETRNKLIVIGCDTFAFLNDIKKSFTSGCVSACEKNFALGDYCSGVGCCQTAVPKSLKSLNITIGTFGNHMAVRDFNPCGFAFLADEKFFNVSDYKLSDVPQYSNETNERPRSDVVVEWVVREETCEEAQSSSNLDRHACGDNTNCTYSENGLGYRCLCKPGFTGNPYLPHGCQVAGGVILIMIISVLIMIMWKNRRKERNFLENGGMLLKHQRVRIFTEAELAKATKKYDSSQFLGEGGFGFVYKGVLEDNTQVAVKKPKDLDKTQVNQEFQHELGIVSQVNHKNVVKILGLCLETKDPLLVYEFISNGSLYQHIHQKRSQILANWKYRLRIAVETALALDYLHSLANPPIIHGDIKSANILLDNDFIAKVSDFGASVLISPGQSDMATKIQGTFGYLDPEYLMTGILTEKSDVYSFGVVLVELLTGQKPNSSVAIGSSRKKGNMIQYFLSSLETKSLSEILCFLVTNEEMEEIETFAEVAKRCLSSSGVNRPTMKEVAEELGRLKKLHENSWAQQNSDETEQLLNHSTQPDTITVRTFDIEFSVDSV